MYYQGKACFHNVSQCSQPSCSLPGRVEMSLLDAVREQLSTLIFSPATSEATDVCYPGSHTVMNYRVKPKAFQLSSAAVCSR